MADATGDHRGPSAEGAGPLEPIQKGRQADEGPCERLGTLTHCHPPPASSARPGHPAPRPSAIPSRPVPAPARGARRRVAVAPTASAPPARGDVGGVTRREPHVALPGRRSPQPEDRSPAGNPQGALPWRPPFREPGAHARRIAASAGWEAAVFDHFQAVVSTLCARIALGPGRTRAADETGGSTYSFDLFSGHPREEEVRGLLREMRARFSALRQAVDEDTARLGGPPAGAGCAKVTFYFGQRLQADETWEKGRSS